MIIPRFSALMVITTGLLCFSFAAQAAMNPFKKTKNYKFGNDVSWFFKKDAAVKSGHVKDGSDTLYYHLNITKDRLRLRLGKNDPSGELEGTRNLYKLAIIDVLMDGKRFSLFDWCLSNQQRPGKKLRLGSLVVNDACVNEGGGDFTMVLDKAGRNQLKNAQKIEFIVAPYNRPVKLAYTMAGFAVIMSEIDKPVPVVKKVVAKVVVKATPKPERRPKKVVRICVAKVPADFTSVVKAIRYRCNNQTKKMAAEKKIAGLVDQEKQKMVAELDRMRQEEAAKLQSSVNRQREIEWDKKQTVIWIRRCNKHWVNGVSPCFCEKYINQAPSGVSNTCGG